MAEKFGRGAGVSVVPAMNLRGRIDGITVSMRQLYLQ